MGTRMDQARTDAAYRRVKKEVNTDTFSFRKKDKVGESPQTKKAFTAYEKTLKLQRDNKAGPNKPKAAAKPKPKGTRK